MDLTNIDKKEALPTTSKEVKKRNWEQLDVILFTGDAYVDHPSFGAAVIGRVLENLGLKVAIVPQPNWRDDLRDFKKLGKPRLFFGVTAGNMDSMVNHYTANRRLRSNDAFTPGDKAGYRPDYPTIVYTQILKKLYPDTLVIIGGIEASLRRLTHYDYWTDKLKTSILYESGADILIYGMAEKAITEVAVLMQKKASIKNINSLPQLSYISDNKEDILKNENWESVELFSHEECLTDKIKFAKNFRIFEEESNKYQSKQIIQKIENKYVVVNPPYPLQTTKELDDVHNLPFTRKPHPRYYNKGEIPAFEMIKNSANIHRGCFGGCSFCTISAHQGKFIISRSEKSILQEIKNITKSADFKGHITDLGGPSANMYMMKGIDLEQCKKCKRPSCIFPAICNNLDTSHQSLNNIYKKVREFENIKMVTIGSGIRYDLIIDDETDKTKEKYLNDLIKYHVSGRLKVAPEHTSDSVLKIMRKPSFELFKKFKKLFDTKSRNNDQNLQLIPYFISSHPGCMLEDMADLAIETKSLNYRLEQVQDFTPTPMTLATVMYYSGINPYTLEKVYIPRTKENKLLQQMFFFWYKKENRQLIINELKKLQKPHLIKKLF
jgi:uncharacterized radical SAM protein YgiQ